ncbi:MAG: ATP-grasp domain-containing protein [Eubacteriales bacterium]|nr:ATP-grasp domain-containing protein [Eubacteriales bacterium]
MELRGKKLLILGSLPIGTDEIVRYAQKMGIYVIVTDHHPVERSVAKTIADEAWMISLYNFDALEAKCRETGVDGIFCGVSEEYLDIMIELCERLHLPCYLTQENWKYSRDKIAFKEMCRKSGVPVPEDYYLTDALTDEELEPVKYPVVVKPVDSNSSQGISFCHNREELIAGYRYARSVSKSTKIIVEQMVPGDEFIVYYAIADGEAAHVANYQFHFQPGEAIGHYCVETSFCHARKQFAEKYNSLYKALLNNMGCKSGYGWFQLRRDRDSGVIYAQEMGFRLSGSMDWAGLEKLNGFSPVKWMLECALGVQHKPSDLPPQIDKPSQSYTCTCFLWVKRPGTVGRIAGIEEVRKQVPVLAMNILRDVGYHYNAPAYGWTVMFYAKDCDEMCAMIEKINRLAVMEDTEGNDMLLRFTDIETIKRNYRLQMEA